jgi:hypothetical protein
MNPDEQDKAKRQAYSFNFPPDKKEKFAALARSMNRPMAWLLLEAIDRMIEGGGTYPTNPPQMPSPIDDDVLKAYVSKADMSEVLERYIQEIDIGNVCAEYVAKATAPMFDDLLNLQSQLAEVKNDCDLTTEGIQRLIDNAIAKMSIGTNRKKSQKVASNNPSEGLSISAFSQRHGLEISRSTPAGEVRAVLAEKGLDSDWQYDARNGRFNPIEYVNMANS